MKQTHAVKKLETRTEAGLCSICGIPVDAGYFDDSKVADAPDAGREVSLARFELPPQYCGVLQYFAQFTDAYAKDPSQVHTPGLQWLILVNKRPLYPYINLDRIVNPWGYGSFQVSIRLDENATIEFAARRVSNDASAITKIGGRIVGRYWYNAIYGDVV
jgi:hypothetical protein